MSKIIIGIHGLGNKPSKELLEKWWLESIVEGLKRINKFEFTPDFEMVYWADILNDKPLSSLVTDAENPYFMDEPYLIAQSEFHPKDSSSRKRFLGFLEHQMDKIFLNDDLTPNFTFVSDLIFRKYFKELDIYYSKEPFVNDKSYRSVRDIIRNRLALVLEKHKGKEVLLIAHSMGSIIAYDVLNFVTPKIKIDTLITIGSPLGNPVIISKNVEEAKSKMENFKHLSTPDNVISAWHNFSDIDDSVAMNYNLADDYAENNMGVNVNDTLVTNDYIINELRNPHKSYGYLRAKELSEVVAEFITKDLNSFEKWGFKARDRITNYLKKLRKNK